jgi:hypothetical protein
MSTEMEDAKTRDALSTVSQYLSDAIAPLQAADSVASLLDQPAELMASEIIGWIRTQAPGNGPGISVADYLFHAVSKLYYLAQLQLIPEKTLAPYLHSIRQLMLDYCPPEERPLLEESFGGIGTSGAARISSLRVIHSQMQAGASKSGPEEEARDRRLSILQTRLKTEVRSQSLPAENTDRENLVPHLIATAAANVRNDGEFRRLQENLRSLGIEAGTDKIFRKLSQSLPGWLLAASGPDNARPSNAAMEAMSQIIHLAEDRWEGCKRFQDMVQAAIEQFNTGSPARAATIFDLALALCSDDRLDPAFVADVRSTAHESLDINRLRTLSKVREKHHLLRKVLNFFDAFAVEKLLEELRKEEKRERRRLLLDLLEIHGGDARKMAFEQLRELVANTNLSADWHFARNLVCILARIPRTGEAPPKAEMQLIAPLLQLSMPGPLVKEAIKFAGQTRCPESEELLISTADKLVRFSVDHIGSDKEAMQRTSLLDRVIFALAHYGTPKAWSRVVKHGTNPLEGLGDTTARLSYLSGQDLTSDKESVSTLLQFLKSKMPRKLFGMTIQKNETPLLHTIKALSSTPAPAVREAFQEIAAQFPETQFGRAAADALKEFVSSDKSQIAAERVLTGDLELFGLPDLLRQLHQLQASGLLTLKDEKGNPIGTVTVRAGRMQRCSIGRLEGREAAYQLLERPFGGTFFFQGQRESGIGEQADPDAMPDLITILHEGMQRYDQLQRARSIVPDFALLRLKNPASAPPVAETDAELSAQLWQKLAAGASTEECETACRADSCRIRTILARWNEEGLLAVS